MRTLRLLAAPLAALFTLAVASPPAQAATIPASRTASEGSALIQGRLISDPATAQRLIEAYWTPERMRAAIPVPKTGIIDDPEIEKVDRPGRVGPIRSAAEPVPPQAAGSTGITTEATTTQTMSTQSVNASPGVGKVFFTNAKNGQDYVCSGSTINSPAKNTVSTAGHCVHGGKDGTWHENWSYVPKYNYGAAPYGVWAAKSFTTVHGWTDHSYHWWDFGFTTMWTHNGHTLVWTTGGQGISFNYGKWINVTLLAYPNAPPFDGGWMQYCQGSMYPYGTQQVGFNCLLTGGASGGPFLRAWDNDLKFGYTNSVISHGPDDKNYGPYFDDDVHDIYNLAKNKV